MRVLEVMRISENAEIRVCEDWKENGKRDLDVVFVFVKDGTEQGEAIGIGEADRIGNWFKKLANKYARDGE